MFENRETIEVTPTGDQVIYHHADWSIVDLSVGARVARGILYLDRMYPEAWGRLDASSLDIQDCDWCVLGQLHGDYIESPEFTHGGDFLRAHGMLAMGGIDPVSGRWDCDQLNEAWREAIRVRQGL